MDKETVTIGIANEGEHNMSVKDMKDWIPSNQVYFSDTVYFKVDKSYYSMRRIDYEKIFNNKV